MILYWQSIDRSANALAKRLLISVIMGLSERKEKIIRAVIDNYVDSCQPVSSADIQTNYLPSLSTATIRNELAALEEMGYLDQPHTSAGRVPTPAAYKLYVEKLMPKRELSSEELEIIRKYFDSKITEIDDVLRSTAKVISEITNLTGVACFPNVGEAVIRNVRIVRITDEMALVVIVTDRGVLKDATVTVPSEVSDDYFNTASNFATGAFGGHRIDDVREPESLITQIKDEFRMVFNTIVEILEGYLSDSEQHHILLEGSSNLLEQPEYSNVDKAKAMLRMLESKEKLAPVLDRDIGLTINITNEGESAEDAPECAIVTANLSTHGVNIGKAGVIGPIRMDYSKIVSVLDYIGKTVNELPVGKNFEANDRSES